MEKHFLLVAFMAAVSAFFGAVLAMLIATAGLVLGLRDPWLAMLFGACWSPIAGALYMSLRRELSNL